MTAPKAIYDTFTIERSYRASPQKIFEAFRDPVKKRRWFAEGEGWIVLQYDLDFRVGGSETSRFKFGEAGEEVRNDSVYFDIVPDARMVVGYSMSMGGAPFSVSLGTLELSGSGDRTTLLYTETTTYLNGENGGKDRKVGTEQLFGSLARELGE
jgi:uncharacterized protein YndB with AHSA1/START domain